MRLPEMAVRDTATRRCKLCSRPRRLRIRPPAFPATRRSRSRQPPISTSSASRMRPSSSCSWPTTRNGSDGRRFAGMRATAASFRTWNSRKRTPARLPRRPNGADGRNLPRPAGRVVRRHGLERASEVLIRWADSRSGTVHVPHCALYRDRDTPRAQTAVLGSG